MAIGWIHGMLRDKQHFVVGAPFRLRVFLCKDCKWEWLSSWMEEESCPSCDSFTIKKIGTCMVTVDHVTPLKKKAPPTKA